MMMMMMMTAAAVIGQRENSTVSGELVLRKERVELC